VPELPELPEPPVDDPPPFPLFWLPPCAPPGLFSEEHAAAKRTKGTKLFRPIRILQNSLRAAHRRERSDEQRADAEMCHKLAPGAMG
jgi:hypothetical protein